MTQNAISMLLLNLIGSPITAAMAWGWGFAVSEVFSDKDWDKLLGSHGYIVALLLAVAALWGSSQFFTWQRHRELVGALVKKDAENREKDEKLYNLATSQAALLERRNILDESVEKAIMALNGSIEGLSARIENIEDSLNIKPVEKGKPLTIVKP